MKKYAFPLTAFLLLTLCSSAAEVVWFDGVHPVSFSLNGKYETVVATAAEMFCGDMFDVTGMRAVRTGESGAVIRVYELDKATPATLRKLQQEGVDVNSVRTLTDGFSISVSHGHVLIAGANGRGCAYGLLEMSRMAGVSPWVWWGDIVPERKERLTIDSHFSMLQGASVEYRGIFLNDEDWSLRHWSYSNHEPAPFGHIGPRTYRRIFELLLRLRANMVWPAMHPGTQAFFQMKGAKSVADSCGIAIGTSHCEPLLRNNVAEWDEKVRGRYNYMTNREAVRTYWAERLQEVKASQGGNLFTIGMRGIHDGSMEGVRTMPEKFSALQQVIDDQQELINRYIGNPAEQTQIFVPYKEVLQIYEMGLKVPDWVTLMWCDDNYGYMTRLSDSTEQQRAGGAGIYYHLSYWGRPHDYLWLTTTQPGLIYHELKQAYSHQMRKIWIANVHDPKVAAYDLELFLDLAWGMESFQTTNPEEHLRQWLCRQFGKEAGDALFPTMHEFYRLCGQRRPEFMGWSQTECDKKLYDRGNTPVRNTEFSENAFGNELQQYLDRYEALCRQVESARQLIRAELHDGYFAAIEYPVRCAAAQAVKILEAQKARRWASGSTQSDMFVHEREIKLACARAQKAYWEIGRLTGEYNETMAGGKWRNSMNMHPRDLPVYGPPLLPLMLNEKETDEILREDALRSDNRQDGNGSGAEREVGHHGSGRYVAGNAADFSTTGEVTGVEVIPMLGHSMKALALPKGESVSYSFEASGDGPATITVALIPTQPNDRGDLRFGVRVDDGEEHVFSLKEPFRSEQWKLNVLRGQATRSFTQPLSSGTHTLSFRALDSHIVLDQWLVDWVPNRKFYLFPVK